MKTKKLSLMVLAATALIFSGSVAASAAPPNSNGAIDQMNSRGSDTTFGMDQKLSDIYAGSEGCLPNTAGSAAVASWVTCLPSASSIQTENFDHDVVAQYDPQGWGSSKGISALCRQNDVSGTGILANVVPTEIARSSRTVSLSDCAGLTARGYAKDGIVPINFRNQAGSPAVGVSNLTVAQLQGIFSTCTITNWNQIGSAVSAPIVVWGVQTGSGTYRAFSSGIGVTNANACVTPGDPDGAGPLTTRVVQENDAQQILSANATTAGESGNSIWFMSFGPWQSNSNLRGGSSFTRVNSITPSGTTIVNGTFPINRFLYMVTASSPVPGRDAARAAASDFVRWACLNSTAHTTALNKPYAALIAGATTSEGFYRNPDNSGTGGTDTCSTITT
jgi:ABC-type phosphate transport system substrate-binding protein